MMLNAFLRLFGIRIVSFYDDDKLHDDNKRLRTEKCKLEEKLAFYEDNEDAISIAKRRLSHAIKDRPAYMINHGQIEHADIEQFLTEINGLLDFIERLEARQCTATQITKVLETKGVE